MLTFGPCIRIAWERDPLGTNCGRDCCNNWSVHTIEFQFHLTLYNILVHLQADSQRVQSDITKRPLATATSLNLFLLLCHGVCHASGGTDVWMPFWSSLNQKLCWAVFQLNEFPDLLHHLAACTNWANMHQRAGRHTSKSDVCGKTHASKCHKPILLLNMLQSQDTPQVGLGKVIIPYNMQSDQIRKCEGLASFVDFPQLLRITSDFNPLACVGQMSPTVRITLWITMIV